MHTPLHFLTIENEGEHLVLKSASTYIRSASDVMRHPALLFYGRRRASSVFSIGLALFFSPGYTECMCSRYTLGKQDTEVFDAGEAALFRARCARLGLTVALSGEVAPSCLAPVLAPSSLDRRPSLFPMQWGFAHPERKLTVINAKTETAQEKELFRESTYTRRCLIPAAGFFEWKKEPDGRKTKTLFTGEGTKLLLGGLYIRASRLPLPVFVILTQPASETVRPVHQRMPLLVAQTLADRFLDSAVPYETLLPLVMDTPVPLKVYG